MLSKGGVDPALTIHQRLLVLLKLRNRVLKRLALVIGQPLDGGARLRNLRQDFLNLPRNMIIHRHIPLRSGRFLLNRSPAPGPMLRSELVFGQINAKRQQREARKSVVGSFEIGRA
jgi:hypothetical protein